MGCAGDAGGTTQTTLSWWDVTTTSGVPGPGRLPDVTVGPELFTAEQAVDIIVRPTNGSAYLVGRLGLVQPIVGLDTDAPTLRTAVLDFSDQLGESFEEGLLAATFSPAGDALYLNVAADGVTEIIEYGVAADGTVAPGSRRVVYSLPQPAEPHNGGSVVFGPDGYLYIFLGDGGLFEDARQVAQDLSSPLGKILRIDPTPSATGPFAVPPDNPFVGVADALPEIWSYGVRNPWRASFDAATGDLWFGDVGEFFYEEVDVASAADGAGRGVSFGWPALEGPTANDTSLSPDGHQAPFFDCIHGELGCSISGGQVYRGRAIPELDGWYVFGDYCSGRVWALETNAAGQAGRIIELGRVPNVVTISPDADGELLAVSVAGPVHRIQAAAGG